MISIKYALASASLSPPDVTIRLKIREQLTGDGLVKQAALSYNRSVRDVGGETCCRARAHDTFNAVFRDLKLVSQPFAKVGARFSLTLA